MIMHLSILGFSVYSISARSQAISNANVWRFIPYAAEPQLADPPQKQVKQ